MNIIITINKCKNSACDQLLTTYIYCIHDSQFKSVCVSVVCKSKNRLVQSIRLPFYRIIL